MSSTQSISGDVLPWEVPTQKTAGNPHSCRWGKLRVGRKQRSCTYGMFSTNFKCAKLQFYLSFIVKDEKNYCGQRTNALWKVWQKWGETPGTVLQSFQSIHLTAEDLIKLSQPCHDYLTAVTLFFVTLCSLPANAALETVSWYQVIFRMTTSLPISISPITQHSHSCFLRMKLLLCTCGW